MPECPSSRWLMNDVQAKYIKKIGNKCRFSNQPIKIHQLNLIAKKTDATDNRVISAPNNNQGKFVSFWATPANYV